MIDDTHAPNRRSWVASANQHAEFPIQNLPLGVFAPPGGAPRGGVAIGDEIFDLAAALEAGLFDGHAVRTSATAAEAASGASLNPLFALGSRSLGWRCGAGLARFSMPTAVTAHEPKSCARGSFIAPQTAASSFPPPSATTPISSPASTTPRTPASCFVPTIPSCRTTNTCRSATTAGPHPSAHPAPEVRRPSGQRKPASETVPTFGPCRNLDYELELGVWIGPGNELGKPIAIAEAADHIAGFCLLNDWSARDIQAWEYQPLGPFLGKSFMTTISPWVVTPEALAPFRTAQAPRPAEDPAPLPYLLDASDQAGGALDIELEVLLLTEGLRAKGLPAHRLAVSNGRHLYWTVAQLVAHHTCNGCNLRPGDIFGTGTISGPGDDSLGSLLEISGGGRREIVLASGETRRFLQDGDTVIMRAHCHREGFAGIGFGECLGTIVPAM